MSCNQNEQVLCCTKFHKTIYTYNSTTESLISTEAVYPVFCTLTCPEDCVGDIVDESTERYYTYTIVESCDECLNLQKCIQNCAVFFDYINCILVEHMVASLEEANTISLADESLKLITFVECLAQPLSLSSPSEYNRLLDMYKNNFCKQSLETSLANPANCGACCINNQCHLICDMDQKELHYYTNNILNLEQNISGIFASRTGKIRASEICEALQGIFLGYNTSCSGRSCASEKYFTS